jgi:hypothetical protein
MQVVAYRTAIENRHLAGHEHVSGNICSPDDATATYKTMSTPPTILEASRLCNFNATQHIQFSLLALVVLREGVARSRLDDTGSSATEWDQLHAEIDAIIGAKPVHLWSQGLAGMVHLESRP